MLILNFGRNIRSCACGKENATYMDLSRQIRKVTIAQEIFAKNQCKEKMGICPFHQNFLAKCSIFETN